MGDKRRCRSCHCYPTAPSCCCSCHDDVVEVGPVHDLRLYPNGMVSAFDGKGQQIPELQGYRLEVLERVQAARLWRCTFKLLRTPRPGDWDRGAVTVPMEYWFRLASRPVDETWRLAEAEARRLGQVTP